MARGRVSPRLGEKKYIRSWASIWLRSSLLRYQSWRRVVFLSFFLLPDFRSILPIFSLLLFVLFLLSLDFQYLHFSRAKRIYQAINTFFFFKIPILIRNLYFKPLSNVFPFPRIPNFFQKFHFQHYSNDTIYESSKSSNRFVSRYCFPKLTWTEWTGWKFACGKLLREHDKGGARWI